MDVTNQIIARRKYWVTTGNTRQVCVTECHNFRRSHVTGVDSDLNVYTPNELRISAVLSANIGL